MSASTSAKQLSEGAPQAAMSWLLHSGIQDASARLTHQGGVHGWYDFDTQSYPFIYSEITGYAIALYSAFFELTGDRAFLARAEDAARWLTQQALHHSGGVRTRLYRSPAHERESVYSFTNETLFTFDTGIALEGLVAVHRHSRNDAHLQAALRMAAFLAGSQQPDGAFAFAVDGRSGEPCAATSSNLQWSRETGPHHARCILGLLALDEAIGEERFTPTVIRLCNWALTRQRPDGRFETLRRTGETGLHPHLYGAEGLLAAGLRLRVPAYVGAARRALIWALRHQLPNGGLPQLYRDGRFFEAERCDVLGQALKLASYFRSIGDDLGGTRTQLENQLVTLEGRLLEFQCLHSATAVRGGFFFGHDSDGTDIRCVNSCSTIFAIRALLGSELA